MAVSEEKVQYKLSSAFDGFTGKLAGNLLCVNGVCTIPAASIAKSGRILEMHYGAKRIVAKADEVVVAGAKK